MNFDQCLRIDRRRSIYIYGYTLFGRWLAGYLIDVLNYPIKGFVVSDGHRSFSDGVLFNNDCLPIYEISELQNEGNGEYLLFINVVVRQRKQVVAQISRDYPLALCINLDRESTPLNFAIIGHAKIKLSEIIQRFKRDDDFYGYSIFARLLAIEQYYGKNDYGYELYIKLWNHLLRKPRNSYHGKKRLEEFKALVDDFSINGYTGSLILVDEDMQIIDGGHRLSLCMYFDIRKINLGLCYGKYSYICLGKSETTWRGNTQGMREAGFTDDELKLMIMRYDNYLKESGCNI